MLKRKKIVRSLLATTLLFFCAARQAMATEFLLFYANDVHAETDPCG
jgi:hypothetical protein